MPWAEVGQDVFKEDDRIMLPAQSPKGRWRNDIHTVTENESGSVIGYGFLFVSRGKSSAVQAREFKSFL